ncbi:uncharacterized protein [Chironomus tepperi]
MRHSADEIYYEPEEFIQEFEENERNYSEFMFRATARDTFREYIDRGVRNLYVELLERLENGSLSVHEIGNKLLKRLHAIDLIRGSGVFHKLNHPMPTNDILDILNQFEKRSEYEINPIYTWIMSPREHRSEILTEYGICYSFNVANSQDVLYLNNTSNDFHYEQFLPFYRSQRTFVAAMIPRRTAAPTEGLIIKSMNSYRAIKNVLNLNIDGAILFMHDPYELPTKYATQVPLNCYQTLNMKIEPQYNTIDESLDDFDPIDRNCYLENEHELKFFKVYTKVNCEQECLSNLMFSKCNCVEYFMIRNSTTPVCPSSEKKCIDMIRAEFEENRSACGCLQPCEYVKYNLEVEETMLMGRRVSKPIADLSPDESILDFISKITVHFKSSTFSRYVRKKQFNEVDFLSFVGGILGLFAGFSVLSFVELFHWFCVKICINLCDAQNRVHTFNSEPENVARMPRVLQVFFESSSVHGLQYFLNKQVIERFFWIIAFFISITICIFNVAKVNEKLPDSRVIAVNDEFAYTGKFEFPAITFLPALKLDLKYKNSLESEYFAKFDKYAKAMEDDNFKDEIHITITKFEFCSNVYYYNYFLQKFDLGPYIVRAAKNASQVEWFKQQFATWNNNFEAKFAEVRTARGMGFSFNLMDGDDVFHFESVSNDLNYLSNMSTNNSEHLRPYPFQENPILMSKDDRNKFTLKFITEPPDGIDQIECYPPAFKIHHSHFIPTFYDNPDFMDIKHGTHVNVVIVPEIIETDIELKKVNPEIRECFFDGEQKLKFFKKYSKENCELECLTRYMNHNCNCSHYIQPYDDIPNREFCSSHMQVICYQKLRALFGLENFSREQNCVCLPTCDSLTYRIQYYPEYHNDSLETSITIQINTDDIILYRRYQQFTASDVVSYVGGLLGLFAGISMLSVVEIIYFFVIRVVVDIFRQ